MIPIPPTAARLIDAANPDGVPVTAFALTDDLSRVAFVDEDGFAHLEDTEQVSLDGLTPTAQKGGTE